MAGKTYDYDELFPNRFLKSGLFKGRDYTLTITDVDLEEMEETKNKKKQTKVKAIVSFRETPKQLVLNKTNGECCKAMFGRNVSAWIGKRVTFCPQTVEAFGEEQLAIRVRGSPDIERDMEALCNLGQKQVTRKLKRTGGNPAKAPKAAASAPAQAAPPPPPSPPAPAAEEPATEPFDATTGELTGDRADLFAETDAPQ